SSPAREHERQIQHYRVERSDRFETITYHGPRFNCPTIQRFNLAKPMIRSGIGYDIHRFAEGLRLILGGVEIAHARGLEGHSDADVLSHAIADALLGAIGAGDIGEHFPNTDESLRGISSIQILKRVAQMLTERNARVLNVDATVIAEAPKLAPHAPA